MFRIACIAALLLGSATASQHLSHGSKKQTLRVCNGYEKGDGVDVVLGKTELGKLRHEACNDFYQPVSNGESIEFHKNGKTIGAFKVGSVPNYDAVLLLVIYKEGSEVAFKSHVFVDGSAAQAALIKTFPGDGGQLNLKSSDKSHEMKYDAQVSVKAGHYDLSLGNEKIGFDMESGKVYVLMMTGPGLKNLVVYAGRGLHRSGAAVIAPTGLIMGLLAVALSMNF
eukprot:TRINITY_DN52303_c0_g1_i1.p1 TRINITY_DN52303_c0_g1~~TRINITY_DN52303_c0_g1_i1.p1  ORF type:complete len:225 (+),score=43.09 TRINITY_DN52303_c0_g1_i1:244-918(+)